MSRLRNLGDSSSEFCVGNLFLCLLLAQCKHELAPNLPANIPSMLGEEEGGECGSESGISWDNNETFIVTAIYDSLLLSATISFSAQ